MEWAGHRVATFAGDPLNLKLTYAEDFELAEQRFARPLVTRTGTGYDVHAFAEGDHVWLGGIRIAHSRGVTAHSDGDVAAPDLAGAPLAWLVGPVAILGCIYLFSSLPTKTQLWCLLWNAFGLLVYLGYARRNSLLAKGRDA